MLIWNRYWPKLLDRKIKKLDQSGFRCTGNELSMWTQQLQIEIDDQGHWQTASGQSMQTPELKPGRYQVVLVVQPIGSVSMAEAPDFREENQHRPLDATPYSAVLPGDELPPGLGGTGRLNQSFDLGLHSPAGRPDSEGLDPFAESGLDVR